MASALLAIIKAYLVGSRVAILLSFALVFAPAVADQPEGNSLQSMRYTSWTSKQGLPTQSLSDLAQTSDGYLWLGSETGLFRFDGIAFSRYELPSSGDVAQPRIFKLFAPPSGGLWIGFLFGGAAFLKDGQLTQFPAGEGFPGGSVRVIAQAPGGDIWFGTTQGLARFDGRGGMQKVALAEGSSKTYVGDLSFDGDGNLWVATNDGLFKRTVGGADFEKLKSFKPSARPFALPVSPTGDLWALAETSDGRGEYHLIHRSASRRRSDAHSSAAVIFTSDGSLWEMALPGTGGLMRLLNAERFSSVGKFGAAEANDVFDKRNGLFDSSITRIYEDREGNVWAFSKTELSRFSERHVKSLIRPDLFAAKADRFGYAAFAALPNGELWIVSDDQPAESLFGKELRRWPKLADLVSISVSGEDLWMASDSKLVRRQPDGRISEVPFPAEAANHALQNMAVTSNGDAWISMLRLGTFRYRDTKWSAYGDLPSLPRQPAIIIGATPRGVFWFGYPKDLLAAVEGDKVKVFGRENGLATGNVMAIHAGGEVTWVGGDSGLGRVSGERVSMLRPAHAHRFDNICGITQAKDGDLWLIGAAGIVRIPRDELAQAERDPTHHVDSEVFDEREAVLGGGVRLRPLPAAIEGAEGRIWFITTAGVYYVDPDRLRRNPLPPPVQVASLTVDGKSQPTSGSVTLPPRAAVVRVDYVGLSLTLSEKVQYRYRLEGLDAEWQEAGSRRDVLYANLSPGTYRFHLRASNNDGIWSEDSVPLVLVMPPAFTQTWLFYALCVLGLAALFALALRLRVRSATARLRRTLEARLAERERIARELHDTLLQSMQGLLWQIHGVVSSMPPTDTARAPLTSAIDRVELALVEGRDRVQGLRAFAEDDRSLEEALSQASRDIAASIGPASATTVDVQTLGVARPLQPDVKDEAFGIAREALVNAFRHAEAGHIDVSLTFAPEGFSLEVRDDGKGLAQGNTGTQARPGHWGLAGMRERAAQIGAQFDVESRPGAGTTIRLHVPADVAYGAKRR